MQNMETRYTHSPLDIRHYSTEELRREFLVEKVFVPGEISLTYTHNDRMIFGGVTPTEEPLEIKLSSELGVDYFLERRELGVINIGGPGFIEIDGEKEPMKKQDGYYIGKETKHVVFSSEDIANPAKFYISSWIHEVVFPFVVKDATGQRTSGGDGSGSQKISKREDFHRPSKTNGNWRRRYFERTENLPIHSSKCLRKLPIANGLHHLGTRLCLEHYALSYSRTSYGSICLLRLCNTRHSRLPHDGQTRRNQTLGRRRRTSSHLSKLVNPLWYWYF